MVRATGIEPARGGNFGHYSKTALAWKRASLATTHVAIRCIRNPVPSLITRVTSSAYPLYVLGSRLPFPLRPRELSDRNVVFYQTKLHSRISERMKPSRRCVLPINSPGASVFPLDVYVVPGRSTIFGWI